VTASYIPLTEATSPSQIRDQFEFEDLGLVCADPGSDTYSDYRCDFEIWNSETGLFLYLGCKSTSPVFSNDTVRTALTHAIDRDYLVESFYRDFAHSACLPASPLSPYYDKDLAARYSFDSDKFTNALTEAELQGASVTLLLNSDDSLRVRVGRAIGKMLTDCGLMVTILEKESADFIEYLRWGEYDLYLGQTKLSPNMDLSAFFQKNGSLNYGDLSDAAIYAISLEALANSGNYYNLHEMVMEDAQLCPILFRSYAIYATRGLVTELTPARDNVFCYTLGRTMADALR
jgi:ABC-type transport system substrate-binding protein